MFMAQRIGLWKPQVQPEKVTPPPLRKFYESAPPPVEPPPPVAAAAPTVAAAATLEAGAWEKPPEAAQKLTKPPGRWRARRNDTKARIPAEKSRNRAVSVSMSREEEDALRTFASDRGINFSEWARQVLFTEAGIPIPPRPLAPSRG